MKIECKCWVCHKKFYRKPSEVKKGYNKFCSRKCHHMWMKQGVPPNYEIKGSYIRFFLRNGTGKLDLRDLWALNQNNWLISSEGYIVAHGGVKMHRLILPPKNSYITDHINGDRTDNRRVNLRYALPAENAANSTIGKNNTSGFKGVHKRTDSGKYRAYININKKRINLGTYESAEDAAEAYNEAALTYHGDFANINNIRRK